MRGLVCLILGHKWRGAGWTGEDVDKDCIGLLFHCYRCGRRVCVIEPKEHVQARYDDGRILYPWPYGEFPTLVRTGDG